MSDVPVPPVPPGANAAAGTPAAERRHERPLRRRSDIVSQAILENLRDHLIFVAAIRDERGDVVDWHYLDMDERVRGWLGLTREDIATRTVRELDPERFARANASWCGVLASGQPTDYELAHGTSEFLVRVFRIDPETLGIAAIDISERKAAVEAQRASEARFRALIEKSADMTALVDRAGRVTYWSPGAEAVLGWTSAEMAGREFASIVHPDDHPLALAVLASPSTTVDLTTVRVRDQSGVWHLLEGVSRNMLDDPDLQGIVINAHDITRQKELEEQFRQAQKLESVGRLAGGVAHDFNNLLTVILNCVDFLERDRQAGEQPKREYIDHIRAAGERASDLTRQLLAFARKQVIAPLALDLNSVVRASEKLLLRVLGEDIELVVRTQPDLWPVLCDRGQIEQVLMNLVVNARDAMPDGGRLEIETRQLEVGPAELAREPWRRTGQWVQVVVRDTGSGMSEETKSHLFEPFYTTKEQGKGTGLGLATVHGIVSQAGGYVHVESEPGRGTTFGLCLPRASGAVAASRPADTSAPTGGYETILVIEDDDLVRGVTTAILRGNGYRVLEAANGREALEVVQAADRLPVLVVTDVVMPGMNGPDVVSALRARYPGLRALYVSGYLENSGLLRGLLDSERDFLAKPFSVSTLLARVRAVLEADGPPEG